MAQTGYTPILIYSSSTGGNAPAVANLTNSTLGSELAINIADGKLFYKDSANAIQVIGWKTVPTTAGGTGLTSYTAGDLVYYASGTTFTKLAIGATGRWLGSSGTAPQWNAPAALTKVDDTNVTLTLGGSASTALLNAASLTLGWTGQLATSRGGTGLASFTANGVVYASSTSALATGSTFVFDGTNVGIATASPAYRLDVNGQARLGGSTGTVFGVGTAFAAGQADIYTTSTTPLGIGTTGSASFQFYTNSAERARITSGGEVYIAGTTDQGAYNLQVNGTGVWGAGAYVNGSDERLKNNIQTLDDSLDVVMAMRPVTFQYKFEHCKDQSIQPGFIAQELQEAMAGKVYLDGVVQSGPEYLNVAYQNIIPIFVKAIQEQQAIIQSLTARIEAVEQTNQAAGSVSENPSTNDGVTNK